MILILRLPGTNPPARMPVFGLYVPSGFAIMHTNTDTRKETVSMFRLWAKIFADNHLLKDTVICDSSHDTRTTKIFRALDEICMEFDLGKPIWLEATIQEFKRHDKARFTQDNFIETIDFDYLEIHVIEED